jgi:scyllo-inositol 2-dehydrogenase (NADP+)
MASGIPVGLVGFGFAGRVFHAPIIAAVPGLRLAAIVQRNGDDAAQLYPGTRLVRSVEEMLATDEIRLVVVATPNTSHYAIAKQCLLADRDVIVDKPFTTTYAEAAELVEIAEKRGRIVTVYQNARWHGDYRTIVELMDGDVLGRIVLYEAHFDRYRLELRPNAWREDPLPGSGVFFDLAPHLIDQAMQLFGPPEAVTADIRIERTGARVDDAFDVTLHYPGMRALLRASMIAVAPALRFLVRGTHGAFVKYGIDPQEAALRRGEVPRDDSWGREPKENWGTLTTPGKGELVCQTIPTEAGDYRLYYEDVRDALLGLNPVDVTPQQALDLMKALELCARSSAERRTLSW